MDNVKKILIPNKDISDLSGFKTKAKSKYYFEINSLDDIFYLERIVDFSKKHNLKILFIGAGTNVLFAFDVFDGIVIKNNLRGFEYDKKTCLLKANSGELISDIAENLEGKYKQNIWHRFIGLPGTLGGAIFGNAGCFGLEIENNFLDTKVYNLQTGRIEVIPKNKSKFSYRSSVFKETGKYFIIEARFDLSKVIEKYHSDIDNIEFRKKFQPVGNSCGSFFKNPSKDLSAGYLIEQVGLKGFHYNSAYFSEKHANFLMTSKDNSDYKDLLYLINLAKSKIKEKFGIDIEEEVRIVRN